MCFSFAEIGLNTRICSSFNRKLFFESLNYGIVTEKTLMIYCFEKVGITVVVSQGIEVSLAVS